MSIFYKKDIDDAVDQGRAYGYQEAMEIISHYMVDHPETIRCAEDALKVLEDYQTNYILKGEENGNKKA